MIEGALRLKSALDALLAQAADERSSLPDDVARLRAAPGAAGAPG